VLTLDQIRAHLGARTYWPGWSIRVDDGGWEGPKVVIGATVDDAYHPGEQVTLDIHTYLPPQPTVADLDRWVVWRLARIAVHEVLEGWRDDAGRPVFDPHADGYDHNPYRESDSA
jgi:hypothetical protein